MLHIKLYTMAAFSLADGSYVVGSSGCDPNVKRQALFHITVASGRISHVVPDPIEIKVRNKETKELETKIVSVKGCQGMDLEPIYRSMLTWAVRAGACDPGASGATYAVVDVSKAE